MKIETVISITSFLFGIGGTLWAVLQWYAISQTKRYAAERDFQHLRANQEQLSQNLRVVLDELEECNRNVQDLARLASILLARSGDESMSGILGKLK